MIGFLVDKVVDAVTDRLKNDKREALLGDTDFVKKQWDDLSAIVDSALSEISDKVTKLQSDLKDISSAVTLLQLEAAGRRADVDKLKSDVATTLHDVDYAVLNTKIEKLETRVDNWGGYLENKNTQPVVKRGRGRPRKTPLQ